MPIEVLISAPEAVAAEYIPHLERAFETEELEIALIRDPEAAGGAEYVIWHPEGPVTDYAGFPKLRAVLSLWAGVERALGNPTLTAPLCRMVDPSLTQGMIEYVTGHVLRYHLGMDAHILGQDGVWRNEVVPPLARDRRVGILGLGALGGDVALALGDLGFQVEGWSRRPREESRIPAHSGEEGLEALLARTEILISLLPGTAATENLLNRRTLAMLPRGAFLINPGRGGVVNDQALIDALDEGQLAHATLDVFRVEPLPPEHPFWRHPRITVTPHVGAETRADTASETIALNIRRDQDGEALLYRVDRAQGY
ncbi:2-hydroxyacid dehydrogenase [Amaricoccus solimangrovi]|uniref:Glyoxylate/hydroxypyruvate reductase A n=1 Tax=Amaricoccus solimangrovi TaxID=2589815 RepID=A0A501WWD8_9RHOB|nr:glyoxylate/hydroxypyruvate reductase A [Amaricoccus solimangrovi]TPE53589.1 glyoxylate/hydroxypyruvate reductase A [Amaricoccus solimangrovi]